MNETMDKLVLNDKTVLGRDKGLSYDCLFDRIPFWFEADLSEELIDELEGEE